VQGGLLGGREHKGEDGWCDYLPYAASWLLYY